MKIQDIVFFLVFALFFYKAGAKLSALTGIVCLVVAIPLFATWVFFTAERLTWYAASFFLLAISLNLLSPKAKKG